MPSADGLVTRAGQQLVVVRDRLNFLLRKDVCIGYLGGHGAGNLGDDALYDAAAALMPGVNVMSFLYPNQERRYAKMGLAGRRFFDAVVLGGGTLINPYPFWIEQTRTAMAQGLPVWALGTGVGSFGFDMPRDVDLQEWADLLAHFKGIGVRGPRSKAALEAYGVANVQIVGDTALGLAWDRPLPQSDPPKVAVNISLTNPEDYGQGEYARIPEIETVLKELVAAGWGVVPIIMHQRDLAGMRRLLDSAGLPDLPLEVLDSTEEFFTRVAPCAFTIAVRLHTAILSCCVGVPPLMLGYRDKCLDFMESMQLEDWYVELHTAPPNEVYSKAMLLSEGQNLRFEVLRRAQAWKIRLEDYVESMKPSVKRLLV